MSWHPNHDDQTILTRHPSLETSEVTTSRALMRFTAEQLQRCAAFHEAAHTVLFLHAGIGVKSVWISPAIKPGEAGKPLGRTDMETSTAPLDQFIVAVAAGERAEDRWMREAGVWTPVRAWAAERSNLGDRDFVRSLVRQHLDSELTFGVTDEGWSDYSAIHAAADRALDEKWGGVLALADALLDRLHLDGEEATRVVGGAR
ncbi:hypothetical protein PV411_36435 [Streptomyces sp. NRRL_B-16638]|uniref:Peptidase M41 domain-containing protein n=2 Tax=Streptomyces coelicolor TaxID=1902 RepID=Q9AD42_STRCO|nr:hypothetical protein [Streptomyces sp. NRRL_B-16638]AGO88570.1 hypothetical protein [Streptomyces coelicolor]MDX2929979.1 hypothetical protein [Streptomyces sp. NRRL_B-16638]CAC36629.1 hypothetical protein [Streptomyces coelicolor A3(2)]